MIFTGSPFKFHVDAVNSGHVTAYGPGLSHGIVNEPAYFTIVTKDAGAGRLFLIIIDKLHCIVYKLHVYQLLIIFYGKLILIGVFKSIVKIKTVY